MKLLAPVLLVTVFVSSASQAQTVSAQPASDQSTLFADPTNAALLYWPAFRMIPQKLRDKVGEQFKNDLFWRPDPELSAMLKTDGQDAVEFFIKASKLPAADWGVVWSDGVMARLSHLAEIRAGSRMLAADERRLVDANEPDAAAARIAAIYRAADHASPDGTMISSLVAAAICATACAETDVLLASGKLTESGKQDILTASTRLSPDDPFRMRNAIAGERRWAAIWLRDQCKGQGANAGKKAAELLGPINPESPEDKETAAKMAVIAKLDEAQLRADLETLDSYYTQALAAWSQPDARQKLADLERGIEQGKFGPFGSVLAPTLTRAFTSDQKAQERLKDTLARFRAYAPVPAPVPTAK